jgi:hypothetical protein
VEDHGRQQEADTFGSTVNGSRQAASLARQVEALVEPQQMLIDLAGNGSDGFLGDTGEDCVAHFLEHSRADTGRTVYTT